MRVEDFAVYFRQASAWAENAEYDARRIMRLVVGPWAELLDGEPIVLPGSGEMVPDFPRVIVPSADRRWSLRVAQARVDVVWEEQVAGDSISDEEFGQRAGTMLGQYLTEAQPGRAKRTAYVARRAGLFEAPGPLLARFFCKPELLAGPLNRPESFEVHAHKTYTAANMPETNSWVRWRTGIRYPNSPNASPCVILENDLNTLAVEGRAYDPREVEAFVRNAPAETGRILAHYLSAPPRA